MSALSSEKVVVFMFTVDGLIVDFRDVKYDEENDKCYFTYLFICNKPLNKAEAKQIANIINRRDDNV